MDHPFKSAAVSSYPALQGDASPQKVGEIAARYGQTPHPELIAELSELYGVSL